MNVQPVHQLAIAIQSSPRLFACLLGSGVSRTAGIRTGWEIVLDLVQKHAEQIGEGAAAAKDPAAWYAAKYGGEPDYSELVSKLATTPDLRRGLIGPYFTLKDAVTGEQREHEPTAAHRAIARLVQRGLLRVIVTTNFDRLMERALRDAGVARVEVVSSEAGAAESYPFHASEAFVFKIHGDWRDVWLRNSRAELAEYPPGIAKLLARIVGEHGLIVSGWSAEYDVALRAAIAARERRFPLYWADPKPSANTSKLIAELCGEPVAATGDEFFSELELAAEALDRQQPPTPLSAEVLIARAKRFIATNNEMELDDLVQDATRSLTDWLAKQFHPPKGPLPDSLVLADQLATECEARSVPLARLLATLARYKQASYLAQRSLSALLHAVELRSSVSRRLETGWWWWFSYPALLCAYAHGVASADKENWRGAITAVRDAGSGSANRELRLPPDAQQQFLSSLYGATPGRAQLLRFTERIAQWLFPLTEAWIPRRVDFERAFDRFDVLLCAMSLRPHAEAWKPRCSIPLDPQDQSSARQSFEDVGRWLSDALDKERNPESAPALWEAFPPDVRDYQGMMDRVRAWKPKAAQ